MDLRKERHPRRRTEDAFLPAASVVCLQRNGPGGNASDRQRWYGRDAHESRCPYGEGRAGTGAR